MSYGTLQYGIALLPEMSACLWYPDFTFDAVCDLQQCDLYDLLQLVQTGSLGGWNR